MIGATRRQRVALECLHASCLAPRSARRGQFSHPGQTLHRDDPTGRQYRANLRVGVRFFAIRGCFGGHPVAPPGAGSSHVGHDVGGPSPDVAGQRERRTMVRHSGYSRGRRLNSRSR